MPGASRDYRLLLAGQTTSQLGMQVSAVAVPLLAVLVLHASALQLGLVNAAGTIAFLLIGLPVGAWTDRWSRRRILVASDVTRAALLATIPVAAATGHLSITQLVVVSLLAGAARVFFDVGYQSYLPDLLGPDRVLGGNATMEAIRSTGQVAGPGLGGWLVGLTGAADVVAVQAGTYLISALSLLGIRHREAPPVPSATPVGLRHQIAEGLRYVRHNRVLSGLVLTSALGNFAFAIASSVLMIFMVRDLRLAPAVIGLITGGGSLAALAGATLTPRLARALGSTRVVWLPLALTAPMAVPGALAQPGWTSWLVLVGTAAGEFGQIVYAITSVSLRQRLCPPRLLGRVNATTRFLIMGPFPAGALLGGALGSALGARVTLLASVLLVTVSVLPTYDALRGTRRIEQLPAWAA